MAEQNNQIPQGMESVWNHMFGVYHPGEPHACIDAPTPELRYARKPDYSPIMAVFLRTSDAEKTLQQKWRCQLCGKEEWRDVPEVVEAPASMVEPVATESVVAGTPPPA